MSGQGGKPRHRRPNLARRSLSLVNNRTSGVWTGHNGTGRASEPAHDARVRHAAYGRVRVNLASILIETARRQPQCEALRRAGRRVRYAELDRASARVAERLAAEGLRPGDRVGLMVPNVPEFVAAYYGILRAGAIVVPLDVDLKGVELRGLLADAGAALLIAWRGLRAVNGVPTWLVASGSFFDDGAPAQEPGPATVRQADDTAVIVYTSGTTAQPKGAQLTHANLESNARVTAALFGYGPRDAVLGALPLAHAFGQTCTLNAVMLAGARLAMADRFQPLDGLTVLVGVPSMYAALLADARDGPLREPALRICIAGGAPLGPELLEACEAAFGTRMLEGYGLTEASPVASFNRPWGPRRPGSIGTPVDGVEVTLMDASPDGVGEIAVRGPNVMKGYWNRPDETRAVLSEDGWLRTGDLARVDDDGAFWIMGRGKDLIIRDGRNVYPREIEAVLYGHPDVVEAAVVGVPDPLLGEEVAACVVVAPGAAVTEAELRDYVRHRVAESKYPRRVWFAAGLPRGRTGKVLKRAIVIPGAVAEIAA
jgi:long-chain acyl-CoA synthetase